MNMYRYTHEQVISLSSNCHWVSSPPKPGAFMSLKDTETQNNSFWNVSESTAAMWTMLLYVNVLYVILYTCSTMYLYVLLMVWPHRTSHSITTDTLEALSNDSQNPLWHGGSCIVPSLPSLWGRPAALSTTDSIPWISERYRSHFFVTESMYYYSVCLFSVSFCIIGTFWMFRNNERRLVDPLLYLVALRSGEMERQIKQLSEPSTHHTSPHHLWIFQSFLTLFKILLSLIPPFHLWGSWAGPLEADDPVFYAGPEKLPPHDQRAALRASSSLCLWVHSISLHFTQVCQRFLSSEIWCKRDSRRVRSPRDVSRNRSVCHDSTSLESSLIALDGHSAGPPDWQTTSERTTETEWSDAQIQRFFQTRRSICRSSAKQCQAAPGRKVSQLRHAYGGAGQSAWHSKARVIVESHRTTWCVVSQALKKAQRQLNHGNDMSTLWTGRGKGK